MTDQILDTQTPPPLLAPAPAPAPAPRQQASAPASPISGPPSSPPPVMAAGTPAPETSVPETTKQRQRTQTEHIYVTRTANELTFLHVQTDRALDATVGTYHSQPLKDQWTLQAIEEIDRMSRARSTVFVHTTESELVSEIRTTLRQVPGQGDVFSDIKRRLKRYGKDVLIARPERESPLWRETMLMLKSGKLLLPSPFVTYTVHTAAFTTYDMTYCGVVMVGLGTIIVHAEVAEGSDLIEAELDMMGWVIKHAGGGGRIDVHHSSDGARRIWEQANVLAAFEGQDTLGQQGSKLRALARDALAQRTSIQPARAPVAMFDQFAKSAASSKFIGVALG